MSIPMRKLYKQVWAIHVSRSAVTPSLNASKHLKKNTKHLVTGHADYHLGKFKAAAHFWRLDNAIMNRLKLTRRKPQYYNAKKATQKALRSYAATLPLPPLEGSTE